MRKVVIHSVGLGKRYTIGERARYLALRDVLANVMNAPRRLFGWKRQSSNSRTREQLWALRDVSFSQPEVDGLGKQDLGRGSLEMELLVEHLIDYLKYKISGKSLH